LTSQNPTDGAPLKMRSWLFAPGDNLQKMAKAADGAAALKGQTLGERSRRLIAIAHPDFRAALDRAAHVIRQRGY
jgi:Acetyl-CoA hydrolase/transferase C-terminal domain